MTGPVAAFLLSLVAAYGVFLLYTAVAFRWRGLGVSPRTLAERRRRRRLREFLAQAGLDNVRVAELAAVEVVLFVVAAAFGWAIWAGAGPAVVLGLAAAAIPVVSARSRRRCRRDLAREAWPRLIEELRLQAVTLGRSIPHALFAVGERGPDEMRPAFAAAHREWLISTDFDRTLDILKSQLADPTADAVCETLLVAHEIGGTDVDRRLRALVDDRIRDLQGRKDAKAKQAGVRFARWFVLLVPVGMAVAGLLIGDGRAAYATPAGQAMVLVAFALMGMCWLWAGRLLRLPEEERVFAERSSGGGG